MHKLVRGLKAAVLLIAVAPLATVGGQGTPTQTSGGVLAAARRIDPSRPLQRAIADVRANTDEDREEDLRDELEEELDDLDADLDELEEDLDDFDADLDVLRDTGAKRRAEEKLRELEADLSNLRRQLRDLRSAPSVGGASRIGAGILELRKGLRELDRLVNLAEDRGEESLSTEEQLRQDLKEEEQRLEDQENRDREREKRREDRDKDRDKRREKRRD